MGGINLVRVVIGGLVAGAIYNILGAIVGPALGLSEAFARFGWDASLSLAVWHAAIRFGFGFISVFTYAAIRPRFGPGLRTAFIAALIMWLAGAVPFILALTELLFFSGWQVPALLAWTLLEATVATGIGGWLYREVA